MKTRIIYRVELYKNGVYKSNNDLLPKEFHLIKTMLKDGYEVKVSKEEVTEDYIKLNFG